MLASVPVRTSYNLEQFDQYKALILSVAIKLIFMGSTSGLIEHACNEIRFYAKEKKKKCLERAEGIEPALSAWKAYVQFYITY